MWNRLSRGGTIIDPNVHRIRPDLFPHEFYCFFYGRAQRITFLDGEL
jgi:hypothetical protein